MTRPHRKLDHTTLLALASSDTNADHLHASVQRYRTLRPS